MFPSTSASTSAPSPTFFNIRGTNECHGNLTDSFHFPDGVKTAKLSAVGISFYCHRHGSEIHMPIIREVVSQKDHPAQVASTGIPAWIFSFKGSNISSSRRSFPCTVLSPPGKTSPSNLHPGLLFFAVPRTEHPVFPV